MYLDNVKIKSFYAQLTGEGALSTVKKSNSLVTTEAKEATLGIPSALSAKLSQTEAPSRSNELLYDGIPTMPREMIDKLDNLGFICKTLSPEFAGKLVLLEGQLSIIDIGVLKDMIEPAMKQEAINSAQSIQNPAARKKLIDKGKSENQYVIEMIHAIPYALEATLAVENQNVWMTLNRDEMVGNPHDINLKHGNSLFGNYHVLGVLDAIPSDIDDSSNNQNDFKKAMSALINQLKILLGRPNTSYGITPIAIFRIIRVNNSF